MKIIISKDGGVIIRSKDIPILFFLIKKLRYLWMVVFGMDTIAATHIPPIMPLIGKKNANEICVMTKK